MNCPQKGLLTFAVTQIEADVNEVVREDRNHDQAEEGIHTRQQTSAEREEDQPIDDVVGPPESSSRGLKKVDEASCDGEVGGSSSGVHQLRES